MSEPEPQHDPTAASKLVLTVYEPRSHGFAKWTTEIHYPRSESLAIVEKQHEGFVWRRGRTGVVTQEFPAMRLSRGTSKRLAQKAKGAQIALPA